jgi:hypothetical protein
MLLALTLAAAAACGDDDSGAGPTPASSTSVAPPPVDSSTSAAPAPDDSNTTAGLTAPEVLVESDLPYYESPSGDVLLLDVYHATEAEDVPLVVVFHSNPVFGRSKENEAGLATIIAERGAVVVAPAYGARLSMSDMGAIGRELERWYREEGPCAVWAAVDLAASYGADPDKLVVIGDVTGTLPANSATFSPTADIAGCLAPPVEPSIATTIFFENDWFMVPSIWDSVIAEDPDFVDKIVPWDHIAQPTSTRIRIRSGEHVASETNRSLEGVSYLESDWIRQRDPEGVFAEMFAASGLLDDGEMSFVDGMQVVTGLLVDAGWDADFAFVPGVGHSLSTAESLELIADLVFEDQTG